MKGLWEAFALLANCSIVFPLIPLCFYPVQDYLKSRKSVLVGKIILVFTGLTLFLTLAEYFVGLPAETNYVLVTVGAYSFYLYNREVMLSFSKKLFVFLTACLVGGFSMLFSTVVDYTLYPAGNYLEFSKEALLAQLLLLFAADGLLYLPFSKYFGWVLANFHEEAVWKRICFFPALFYIFIYCAFPRKYSTMYVGMLRYYYPVVLIFLLFFVILLYFLFYITAFTYVQKQKTEIANRMLSVQGAQYQQLLKMVEQNGRIRHDFRHQLIVISELLGQKEYGKLEEYIHDYIEDTQTEVKCYSYSAPVNALISYYESVCLREGIRTDFSVSLPNRLPVSDQDFCVLLGNLLENAAEGSQRMQEPYVCLKIRQTASNVLAIKVANPYCNEFKKEKGHYLSSKREGFGQGLESVNLIVEKYQGVMEIFAEGQLFVVKILLQISADTVLDGER